MYKRPEKAATWPNKQFRNNSLFSLPICQEEINKVIFAWVYELENNFIQQSKVNIISYYHLKFTFYEQFVPTLYVVLYRASAEADNYQV